ncbi:MAG: carboxypeptidase-like regulatory domain-containing protein [Candidatus Aenigmatarchaeota archaeon]
MKKYIFLLFFISVVSAEPIISNITIFPKDQWLGEQITVRFNCTEENQTIQKIHVMFLSPIEIPNSSINLQKANDYYFSLNLNYPYTGKYTFQIYCESDALLNNFTQKTFDFNVFNLSAYIESIKPGKIYEGDEVKIFLRIKKNDLELNATSNINFQLLIDGSPISYSTPIYFDAPKGWVLSFYAPLGEHKIKIISNVDGKSVEIEKTISVQKAIDISFLDIDKTEVLPNDFILMKFFAKERDYIIDNSSLSVSVYFDSNSTPFNYSLSDSLEGTVIDIRFKSPEVSIGEHTIKTKIKYKNREFQNEMKIYYPIKIEGSFSGEIGSLYNGKIKFKNNNFEKLFSTNSSGYFSGTLPKGKYNIEIELKDYPNYPGIRLILNDTEINSFGNFLKFDVLKDINIDGLGLGAAYYIKPEIDFSRAYLEISYDQRKINNENDIVVYKCDDWNFIKNKCNKNLQEIEAYIDKDKNIAKFDIEDFSTFIIAYRKKLTLNLIQEKRNYNLKDTVSVSGYIQDEEGNYIQDANVNIKVVNTGIEALTKTDKNGYFSQQFLAPEKEGIFKIEVKASKEQFILDAKSTEINITKNRKLVLFTEDSFRVYIGENITLPLKIINTGQADISKFFVNISGLPQDLKLIIKQEDEIKSGEEKEFPIQIFVPPYINQTNYLIKIQLNYDGNLAEKQILLSIEEKPKVKTMPTAKLILPKIDSSVLYTFIVCISIIFITYILKKNKPKKQKDDLLKQIKNEIIKNNLN